MDTNIKYLVDNGINIWNKDAYNWYKANYDGTVSHKYQVGGGRLLNYDEWLVELQKFPEIGDLGRVYGAQWRRFGKYSYDIENGYDTQVDQISNLIKGLKENPMGTKHIVTAWNPSELDDMALPPCHWSFEILVEPLTHSKRRLNYLKKYNLEGKSTPINSSMMDKDNEPKYQFTLKWHQRSVDSFLGKM